MDELLPEAESVAALVARFESELAQTRSPRDAQMLRDRFLGRKNSIVASWMQQIATASPDRKKAIGLAIEKAGPGDIVLLAGKGHEKVQVSREGTIPFDDVAAAREALHAAGYDCETASTSGKTS